MTETGVFWTPENPTHRVSGRVTIDGTGVHATLHQPLTPPAKPDEVTRGGVYEQTYPHVHGQLADGRLITLTNVHGWVDRRPGTAEPDNYLADVALLGGHTTATTFTSMQVGFDILNGWTDPDPIADEDDQGHPVLHPDPTTLLETTWRDLTIRLTAYAVGIYGPDVHLDREVRLEIDGPPADFTTYLNERVQPLHDLLTVATGAPVVITSITVQPDGAVANDPHLEARFHAFQADPADHVTPARFRNYDSPTLLLPDTADVDLPRLITNWLDLYDDHAYAIQLLCAPMNAPFMYVENRLTSTFQALEQVAIDRVGNQERPKAEHNTRVEAVLKTLTDNGHSQEDIDWVQRRLRSSNTKKLVTLLTELFNTLSVLGETLNEADAPKALASARGQASHGARGKLTAEQKHWLERGMTYAARVDLLHAAGVPLDTLAHRAAHKPEFQRAIETLRAL